MAIRLKIDLTQGLIEVEGNDDFVKRVYDDFLSELKDRSAQRRRGAKASSERNSIDAHSKSLNKKKPHKKSRSKASPTIVKDLVLSGKALKPELKTYYAEKKPKSFLEKNAVFVYYLSKTVGITAITVNHVYSCYKEIRTKYPSALEQSLLDTAYHKGWIDTSTMDNIKLSAKGENFVEHDLPSTGEIKAGGSRKS